MKFTAPPIDLIVQQRLYEDLYENLNETLYENINEASARVSALCSNLYLSIPLVL
jgi:hypothetical protein